MFSVPSNNKCSKVGKTSVLGFSSLDLHDTSLVLQQEQIMVQMYARCLGVFFKAIFLGEQPAE
jgi:hypothetical protein